MASFGLYADSCLIEGEWFHFFCYYVPDRSMQWGKPGDEAARELTQKVFFSCFLQF